MRGVRVPILVQWIAGAIVCIGGISCGVAASRVIWYEGDYMIGFHPLILFAFPMAALLVLIGFICALLGGWRFGIGALIGGACIIPAFGTMSALYGSGPEYGIATYAGENAAAVVAANLPEVPEQSPILPYDETKLVPVAGFRWYCGNHIAAPDGVYFAWKSNGVVHIRVQKQHGGWQGLAYSQDARAIEALRKVSGFHYDPSQTSGWWHWDTLER